MSTALPHYTPDDLAKVEKIKAWLTEHEKPRSWLTAKTRIPSATISQILNGKYPSPPTAQLTDIEAAIALDEERAAGGAPGYVKGAVHKLINVVADRTRKHATFGVVTGRVGVGKTRTLKEYRAAKPQTILLESSPNMTQGVMLNKLLKALGSSIPTGLENKFEEVVRVTEGTGYLIIVDEAENMSAPALHYLRRIRDMAGIGILLAGTEKLHDLLNHRFGQFDQIRSRVVMWPKTIQAITRDDADDMARAALADMGEVGDDVLNALWSYGTGSARVLMEALVPAIRDFGKGRVALSPELVDQVAERVLSLGKGGKR
jgi:DNA transposition AAA+ family ATPase